MHRVFLSSNLFNYLFLHEILSLIKIIVIGIFDISSYLYYNNLHIHLPIKYSRTEATILGEDHSFYEKRNMATGLHVHYCLRENPSGC